MKRLGATALLGFTLLAAASCGGAGETETPAEDIRPGVPANVTVVPYETLQGFLPVLDGWERLEPRGETDTTESVSRVTVSYEKSPSTLSFEIMDSSMNEAVLALFKEALGGDNPELTPTTLEGFPGAEQWISEASRGAVHVLVGGRFMVVVTGENVPDLATIRQAVEAIELEKMATLK